MFGLLKHILGIEESVAWSTEWKSDGRSVERTIIEETDVAICVERESYRMYKHVETGEVRHGGIVNRSTEWYWKDEKESWPAEVRHEYDSTEVAQL